MILTHAHVRVWIQNYRDLIAENVDELNKLDAATGDGDFGASMQRGLDAAVAAIEPLDTDSIGKLLRTVGMTLVCSMGGTSGPLVGTLFTKMGAALGDTGQTHTANLAAAFRAGAEGVMALGQAEPGDKTMIDSLLPSVDTMEAVIGGEHTLQSMLAEAADAARSGAEHTKVLSARKGRASYVGGGGVGCVDPGAAGMSYMFIAFVDAVGEGRMNPGVTQPTRGGRS